MGFIVQARHYEINNDTMFRIAMLVLSLSYILVVDNLAWANMMSTNLHLLAVTEGCCTHHSQLCWMSVCRFCCPPNSDIQRHVGDMSPTCCGHAGNMTRCHVSQGVQNDTTCRLFPTCRLNVVSSVTWNSAQTYSIRIIHWLNISLLERHPYDP